MGLDWRRNGVSVSQDGEYGGGVYTFHFTAPGACSIIGVRSDLLSALLRFRTSRQVQTCNEATAACHGDHSTH